MMGSSNLSEKANHWLKRYWFSLILGVVLIGVFGWGFSQYRAKNQLNNFVETGYQRAFYGLIQNVENVDVLLAKGLVSTSPRQNILLFSNAWRESYAALDKLNQLPLAHQTIDKTSKFFSQVGDFSFTLSRQLSDGQDISSDQRTTLRSLQKEADYLATELHALQNNIRTNQLAWGEIRQQGTSKFREVSPQLSEVSFRNINNEMDGMPTLIYDGPFSDHITQLNPQGVTGAPVSAEEAAQIAMQKADLLPGIQYAAAQMGTGEGKIPIYRIQITDPAGQAADQIVIDISRTGGHVVSYLNARPLGAPVLDGMQAQEKAIAYLEKKGFPALTSTHAQVDDGSATIAFAGVQDGVILYPDQIKVKVALDNGQVIGVESLSYLMAHHERDLAKPKVSAQTIRERAAKSLEIEAIRLALIPLETRREVLCWEVKGNLEGELFFLYFNALDGNQERILKVINTPAGPVTI